MNFANLFVDSDAGELLYFLVAVGLSLTALLMALDQWTRSPRETEAYRYMVALVGVVIAWIFLTLSSLNALLDATDFADTLSPPMERVTTTMVIVALSWAFLTAESPRRERGSFAAAVIILLALIAGLVITLVQWNEEPASAEFNRHRLGMSWTFIAVLLTSLAMLLMVTRYRFAADIPLKMLFYVVVLVGHGYTLYEMSQDQLGGDVAGTIRVSMLAALVLVPVILYRLILDRFRSTVGEVTGIAHPGESAANDVNLFAPPAPKPVSSSYQEALNLLKILGVMLEKTTPEDIPIQIVKAAADTFKSDVVALAVPQDANWADTIAAYDYIREQTKPGMAINLANQPTLANAIETVSLRMLLPGEHEHELNDLYHRLDVDQVGPVGPAYFQPLSRDRKIIGVLMLVMPYTSRLLNDEEKQMLSALAPLATRLLAISQEAFASRMEAEEEAIQRMVGGGIVSEQAIQEDRFSQKVRTELQADLEAAREQINQLTIYVNTLQQQLHREQDKLAALAGDKFTDDAMSITQRINVISNERSQLAKERVELMSALEAAQALMAGATADTHEAIYQEMIARLEQEKQDLLATKERLETELSQYLTVPADPDSLGEILVTVTAERDRLAKENHLLKNNMQQVTEQLARLGFENSNVGISQLIAHLTDERNKYEKAARRARNERDLLLRERDKLNTQRAREKERDAQIDNLQKEVARLAADRETLTRQRDALKVERDSLNQQRDQWLENRVALTQQYEELRQQLESAQQELAHARAAGAADPTLQPQIETMELARQQSEWELLQARNALQQLERELEQLRGASVTPAERANAENIVRLAQEVRTPATSVMNYSDLILSESVGILTALQRQLMLRIRANAERLREALGNLVSVLQMDFGTMSLETQAIQVQDVIDDAITSSNGRYQEKGLTLLLQIDDNLPAVQADYDAMQQILTQLLVNAHLASPPDSDVEVKAEHIPDFRLNENDAAMDVVLFSVTDRGGGIDESLQAKIFNRIYRTDAPIIPGLGDNGIGLPIAFALANAHGGRIWYETRPNEGTTFKVMIPVDQKIGAEPIVRNSVNRLIEIFKDEP